MQKIPGSPLPISVSWGNSTFHGYKCQFGVRHSGSPSISMMVSLNEETLGKYFYTGNSYEASCRLNRYPAIVFDENSITNMYSIYCMFSNSLNSWHAISFNSHETVGDGGVNRIMPHPRVSTF